MNPYELVQSEAAHFPVRLLCDAAGISRSAFYAQRTRAPSKRSRENERLLTEIRALHTEHHARLGSPRMCTELAQRGVVAGRHRVARLMRENRIVSRAHRKFRHTTDSAHALPVAPNLLAQRFTADEPNRVWVGDITYLWTAEGWAYLSVLLDLYSRRVVGWALRETLHRELAVTTLQNALALRRPPAGLICHSDRGSQYASAEYRALLAKHGARASMSGAGNCYDNAVAESFFASLKKELVHSRAFQTRTEAYDAVAEYIDHYYNAKRPHSAAQSMSPTKFELATARQHAA